MIVLPSESLNIFTYLQGKVAGLQITTGSESDHVLERRYTNPISG